MQQLLRSRSREPPQRFRARLRLSITAHGGGHWHGGGGHWHGGGFGWGFGSGLALGFGAPYYGGYYGPYAYDYGGPYAYGGDCVMRRRWVYVGNGHRVLGGGASATERRGKRKRPGNARPFAVVSVPRADQYASNCSVGRLTVVVIMLSGLIVVPA